MKKILITGCCGFIGFHLTNKLLKKKFEVYGIDNFSKSYDLRFKKQRHAILQKNKKFNFFKKDLKDVNKIKLPKIDIIFHLAAEAGVRKSIDNPLFYIDQNINNTIKIYELARRNKIKKVLYASSSSVYGFNKKYPTKETNSISQPLSVYGISKIATENIAYYYFKIFKISSIGFRFFTVYGPYGRPDMSIFIFFKSIFNNKKIYLFNKGKNFRDFTYIDDVINYLFECMKKINKKKEFFDVFNIGDEKSIGVLKLISIIQKLTNKKAKIILKPKVKLDPEKSLANMNKINNFVGKKFKTKFKIGIINTFEWVKKNKNLF